MNRLIDIDNFQMSGLIYTCINMFFSDKHIDRYQYVYPDDKYQYVFQMSSLIDINVFSPDEHIDRCQYVFQNSRMIYIYMFTG